MEGRGEGPRSWENVSLDKLRESRAEALRLAERAGEQAEDYHRQSESYAKAAKTFENRAYEAEALAKTHEKEGDLAAAAKEHERYKELRALTEDNFRIADEKQLLASDDEHEAHHQRETARQLAEEIKQRPRDPGD